MTPQDNAAAGTRSVAVIGSGVAGLTAAYVAAKSARVTLFEADDRLGGHADTHDVESPEGVLAIDTGFHRSQRAHLPDPAEDVRRTGHLYTRVGDVDVRP